ncbi:DNA-binding response regulator [Alteromonas sp. KUL42]|uniref:response regulator transcription factor n=1 Tax=Alteromonas sp. KUL42 TaxID=2480797 RepID=UPI001036900B|nr:response regulator transcription factor [Alteromonas sp. KUL42]TAP34084.1 response regulator transcription factor [Alteromonas sp. KUL42]GEA08156.1 DNA-binding response regulator [Alteromonas sp. KUL42]
MNEKVRLLLVEDTKDLAAEIYDFLEAQGMEVDYAATGKQAMLLMSDHRYDVIILDIMLPDMSGIEICQFVKSTLDPTPPVLMLTARDSIQDKIVGFDAGTDDYLTKPFDSHELLIRCKALMRRQQLHKAQNVTIGELSFNDKQQVATRNGCELKLSSTSYTILRILVKAYPNAVSRREIIDKVWGDDLPDSDALRSHIYTLRQVVDKPFETEMIKTIHGIGFKLSV